MFDRLQVFHQRKVVRFLKVDKGIEKRLARLGFFWSRAIINHGTWLVTLLVEYLANGMKAALVHLLEHLCQFFYYFNYSHRLTLTRRKSRESGITTLCLQG